MLPLKLLMNFISFFGALACSILPPSILTFQLVLDYAQQQNWKQVVFFDCPIEKDCNRDYLQSLIECFSTLNIAVSLRSAIDPNVDLLEIFKCDQHRLGIVLLMDDLDFTAEGNIIHELVKNQDKRSSLFGDYLSWLIVSTKFNITSVFDVLRNLPIGVDSDVTVAVSFLSVTEEINILNEYWNWTCPALRRYGNQYNYYEAWNLRKNIRLEKLNHNLTNNTDIQAPFYLMNVYKVRVDDNSTFLHDQFDFWIPGNVLVNKEKGPPSHRRNFQKIMIKFGLLNSSKMHDDPDMYDNSTSGISTQRELINIFKLVLNASETIKNYENIGTSMQTKEYSDLLRDVVTGAIDIGVAYMIVDPEFYDKISFSHPLVQFTRNIYYKPPESGLTRNIFLQPFKSQLLLCVAITVIIIIGVFEFINYVAITIRWNGDEEHFGLGEAALWCLSIMCMQGSPWTPRTRSGKTVLLSSLIFALITYNAYSGFITSILSVQADNIKNVSDFSKYDYKFGSSKSDDAYIRTTEIGILRDFYSKALQNFQSEVNEKEGLQKAIEGNYAFFVIETLARRVLRTALVQERCIIKELQLFQAPGSLALPLDIHSPYKKIINLSILRSWESGVLQKLGEDLKPQMLNCLTTKTFHSARLQDVYGAFIILGCGATTAVIIFTIEKICASEFICNYLKKLFVRYKLVGKRSKIKNPDGILKNQDHKFVPKKTNLKHQHHVNFRPQVMRPNISNGRTAVHNY